MNQHTGIEPIKKRATEALGDEEPNRKSEEMRTWYGTINERNKV